MGTVVLSCDPAQRERSFCGGGHPAGPRRVCFKAEPSWTPAAERTTVTGQLNAAQLRRDTGEKVAGERSMWCYQTPGHVTAAAAGLPAGIYLCVFTCWCAVLSGGEAHWIHLVHLQVVVEDLEDLLYVRDVTRLKLRPHRDVWGDMKHCYTRKYQTNQRDIVLASTEQLS